MGGSELTPTTRQSIDLSPHLSELMDKLKEHASSFIREFDSREPMRQIVRKFREIPDEVRKMQKRTDEVRRAGAVTLVVSAIGMPISLLAGGAALGAEAAGGAGGASALIATLWPRAAAAAAVITTVGAIGSVLAAGSAIAVAGANVTKGISENGSINKVKQLGKEFMEMVEPLKNDLEEIMRTCEELEQRSAERQAGITLTDMEDFQWIVSELGSSDGVLSTMWKFFTPTATPEEDRKLRDSIIQSADLSQKVIDDLEKMKEELKDFTEQ
ncbi:uncharacterized protein LOC120545306 [Perca fluviatilis]|uniref:uncharacterized protein LOC120545306 n=1 Tax=Perca fluviatilis TaxID=8168 RepID=UPI001964F140|nr:uncharacterized protein LOC120545306 [Perca fluviatilis]